MKHVSARQKYCAPAAQVSSRNSDKNVHLGESDHKREHFHKIYDNPCPAFVIIYSPPFPILLSFSSALPFFSRLYSMPLIDAFTNSKKYINRRSARSSQICIQWVITFFFATLQWTNVIETGVSMYLSWNSKLLPLPRGICEAVKFLFYHVLLL